MPSISPQRRHGKIVGYSVYLGSVGNERRARRFFPQRRAAERFLAQQTTTPVPVGELWERKAELLYAMERLRPLGTNLADVVSFYLSHQNTTLGQKLVSEVLEEFLTEKLQVGRSRNYERNMRKTFTKFLNLTDGDRKIGEITRRQIADYVYVTHGHLSNVTKKNLLTNFSGTIARRSSCEELKIRSRCPSPFRSKRCVVRSVPCRLTNRSAPAASSVPAEKSSNESCTQRKFGVGSALKFQGAARTPATKVVRRGCGRAFTGAGRRGGRGHSAAS